VLDTKEGRTLIMTQDKASPLSEDELKILLEFIKSVKFGSVTLIIQDGKIVQMEKSEKVRLT
jgi:hypothetical protein